MPIDHRMDHVFENGGALKDGSGDRCLRCGLPQTAHKPPESIRPSPIPPGVPAPVNVTWETPACQMVSPGYKPRPHLEAEGAIVATGTPNQQERWAAGLLPEDELAQLARVQLFAHFGPFPRWATSRDRERMVKLFRHGSAHGDATSQACHEPGALEFEVCDLGELGADEWSLFKKLTIAAGLTHQHPQLNGGSCKLEPLQHWVTCKECGAELARVSVKVTIAWAGRELVREYALDPERYETIHHSR